MNRFFKALFDVVTLRPLWEQEAPLQGREILSGLPLTARSLAEVMLRATGKISDKVPGMAMEAALIMFFAIALTHETRYKSQVEEQLTTARKILDRLESEGLRKTFGMEDEG